MKEIIGYLDRSISTICFNWIDQTALTGRYHESMACGMFPFVWKDYDTNNTLVWYEKFQRISTVEEYYERLKILKDNGQQIVNLQNDFEQRIPQEEYYYFEFQRLLNEAIK